MGSSRAWGELCGRDDDPGPSPALCSTWGTKAGRRIGALWGATAVGERDGGVCHGGQGHLGQRVCACMRVCVCALSAYKKSWRRVWGALLGSPEGLSPGSLHENLPLRSSSGSALWQAMLGTHPQTQGSQGAPGPEERMETSLEERQWGPGLEVGKLRQRDQC